MQKLPLTFHIERIVIGTPASMKALAKPRIPSPAIHTKDQCYRPSLKLVLED
jgi:hypothetical protein